MPGNARIAKMSITRTQVQQLAQKAQEFGITKSEIADLAGVRRETVYRTFARNRMNLKVIAATSRLISQYKRAGVVTPSEASTLVNRALA